MGVGKRLSILLSCILSAGCSHAPPPYTSRYAPPPNNEAVFIGDSWTEGYNATPETRGYAYLTEQAMGWTGPVYGASGTGYTKGTNDGATPAYAERIASLPGSKASFVVLQGSVNDLEFEDWNGFPGLADQVIGATKERYSAALIVIFGPCDYSQPSKRQLPKLDSELALAAQRNDLHYISCYQERWITDENRGNIMDPSTNHPSTEGHALIAKKLTADLRAITNSG